MSQGQSDQKYFELFSNKHFGENVYFHYETYETLYKFINL